MAVLKCTVLWLDPPAIPRLRIRETIVSPCAGLALSLNVCTRRKRNSCTAAVHSGSAEVAHGFWAQTGSIPWVTSNSTSLPASVAARGVRDWSLSYHGRGYVFLTSSHEELKISSSETYKYMTSKKFVRVSWPTFLCGTRTERVVKKTLRYSLKIIVLTGGSPREELNRSETFQPKSSTPTVGLLRNLFTPLTHRLTLLPPCLSQSDVVWFKSRSAANMCPSRERTPLRILRDTSHQLHDRGFSLAQARQRCARTSCVLIRTLGAMPQGVWSFAQKLKE